MSNRFHHFIHSILCRGHRAIIPLACVLGLLVFASLAQAQDGGPDPATSVEVSGATVWRDAVTTGSVTITCYDAAGKPVPNDSVSISITSPGEITDPSGLSYTYSSSTSGTTDSNGTVTVTVLSTDFTLVGDDATATVTAAADGTSGTGSVLFKGALELLCNKIDATNKTNSCNVGELQSLEPDILSGVPCTNTWTASGATPIGGWDGDSNPSSTLTTPFPPGSLDGGQNSPQTLYLTTTGSDTATLSANDYAATATASTSFTVSRPTDFSFTAVQQAAQATSQTAPGIVGVGDFGSGGSSGIQFTGSGGSGGTLTTAQIISSNAWTYTLGSGSPVPGRTGGTVPGIDTGFPYSSGSTNDSPDRKYPGPISDHLTNINEPNWSATMYLMWKSSKSGSISIPVESIGWSWNANANYDSKTGKLVSSSGSSAVPSKSGTSYNAGVLRWTSRVTGTGN